MEPYSKATARTFPYSDLQDMPGLPTQHQRLPIDRASRPAGRRAFSILELLVTMSIVAVLLSLLLPSLRYVRFAANGAICATNLRQIGIGWRQYVDDHRAMPFRSEADWKYGGAAFVGAQRRPVLAADRPINDYILADADGSATGDRVVGLFRSPLDRGYRWTEASGRPVGESLFVEPTVYERFGTSYRANPLLLDKRRTQPFATPGPMAEHEIVTMPSMLLLVAVPQWQIAVDGEQRVHASWHPEPNTGNVLFLDGAVRHVHFGQDLGKTYDYLPKPIQGPPPIIGTPMLP